MNTIVPYVASELAKESSVAVDIVKEAISTGRRAAKGRRSRAKSRGRSRTRSPIKAVQALGRPEGSSPNKRNDVQAPGFTVTNKFFGSVPLIRVEKDVAGSEVLTKRSRDTLNHKGCKVCFAVKNIRQEPIFFNWAIVTPKASNAVSSLDFLRGDGLERDQFITNQTPWMDLRCNPINTDRYHVMNHRRMTILPDSIRPAPSYWR